MWTENDPTVAQVSAAGIVFGFMVGATEVLASDDRVDADDSVNITVIPGEGGGDRGSGYPRVLISDIDPDPDTGEDVTLSPEIRPYISASMTSSATSGGSTARRRWPGSIWQSRSAPNRGSG